MGDDAHRGLIRQAPRRPEFGPPPLGVRVATSAMRNPETNGRVPISFRRQFPPWLSCLPLAGLLSLCLPIATAPGQSPVAVDRPAADTADADALEVSPAPLQYMGREIAQTMHYSGADWLLRDSRGREEDCQTMLRELRLKPGMRVCDMGCGNGFYSLQLAELVGPQGEVLAVDIQSGMLRLLQARAEEAGLRNLRMILGDPDNPKLPRGQVQLILCVDVYHEFSHPAQMLAAMRESLADGGQLVLVEFRAEDPDVPIKPLHKMSKPQILKELQANGFRLCRQFDKLPWQHMMFFEAADSHEHED